MKFEYLSYCLKVKEMDDEEYSYQALQEPLYRVETGNYEYRYCTLTLKARRIFGVNWTEGVRICTHRVACPEAVRKRTGLHSCPDEGCAEVHRESTEAVLGLDALSLLHSAHTQLVRH